MKKTPSSKKPTGIRINSYRLKTAEISGLSPREARKLLEKTVKSISDNDLKNLRGGQILLVA
ncbi:MAG TPA: hypothetical protein VN643_25950 [Pyrinomonadaceae bacterium]|nr:hypothetical protein [Pyrinomonadaceae bacterium]